jgi:two-component system, NarL family, nitrate/nitrite response regulator NarL
MTSLFVVAETRLYREGLADALARAGSLRVLGTAADVASAVAAFEDLRLRPEVALVDRTVPEGPSAVTALTRACPCVRVVAVAVRESDHDVIEWAEAGAAGFVPHDASLDQLMEGVHAVARGDGLCPPGVAATVLAALAALAAERRPPKPSLGELTRREREVALLLEEGLSNKEIAQRLSIEEPTVKNHVHHVLEKLAVRRRGEAASMVRACI